MTDVKMCSMCRAVKPLSEFTYKPKRGVYDSYCKECNRAYQRAYKKARREMAKAEREEHD